MSTAKNYVWYAGYGSNLSRQRFLCYIQGGTPTYGKTPNHGCFDITEPPLERQYIINYELYFAIPDNGVGTERWGPGGVAFIDPKRNKKASTICRIWKITEEQYEDVCGQEGKLWYNKRVKLGKIGVLPVWTITNNTRLNNVLGPSNNYLKTLILGLRETNKMQDNEIANYLVSKAGVAEKYSLKKIIQIAKIT